MTAAGIDLRLGRWQDVLAEEECDALIADPQFSARTHAAQKGVDGINPLPYEPLDHDGVREIVGSWSPRVRGWMCFLTSHDLIPAWEAAFGNERRYCFAPIPVIIPGMSVRKRGDGPSSESVSLIVARPRNAEYAGWGTRRGYYMRSPGDEPSPRAGGKPLRLMQAIVRDYSRPGDVVIDTHAGGGTTLLAAVAENREAIGAEIDPEAHAQACARWSGGYTPSFPWAGPGTETP